MKCVAGCGLRAFAPLAGGTGERWHGKATGLVGTTGRATPSWAETRASYRLRKSRQYPLHARLFYGFLKMLRFGMRPSDIHSFLHISQINRDGFRCARLPRQSGHDPQRTLRFARKDDILSRPNASTPNISDKTCNTPHSGGSTKSNKKPNNRVRHMRMTIITNIVPTSLYRYML